MSTRRFSRLRLVTAIGPLLVVSAAWAASGSGPQHHSALEVKEDSSAPTTSRETLPQAPLGRPVSVTQPVASQSAANHIRPAIVSNVSAAGIPAAALAAYQRAATIVDDADPQCRLDWPLLAAIGRVESDHGRAGGSRLTSSGVARPAILGPVLTGKHRTSRVADTDHGRYDGDTRYDRAVGPLQFLPSTWAIVGVDADGDGKRDPQDINDAALGAAVFLCSGSELSDAAGQRAALFRYNHSRSYVATVLDVAAAYRTGRHPTTTIAVQQIAAPLPPASTDSVRPATSQDKHDAGSSHKHSARPHGQPWPDHHHAPGLATQARQHPAHHGAGQGTRGTDSARTSSPIKTPTDKPDTTAPAAPIIASPANPTNDATPTVSGTGEPKATVTVEIAGAKTGTTVTATVTSKGAWSVAPRDQLDDGDYTVTATQTDTAGNTSGISPKVDLTVDTAAPEAPTVTRTPTAGDTEISGTGEAGATVTVLIDGEPDGTAPVRDDGTWTVPLETALVTGGEVTTTQTDAAGNTSLASDQVTVAAEPTPSDPSTPAG